MSTPDDSFDDAGLTALTDTMHRFALKRIYREVKVMMIGGGTEEIMKDLAARQWQL